jgi:outer membrane protein TolC
MACSNRFHGPAWAVAALLLGCGNLSPAEAQTLTEALNAAWARQPLAVAVSARRDEAQAGLALADGLTPGPASVSLNHLNDRWNRNQGRREWEIELATPLWLPGQQAPRAAVAAQAVAETDTRTAALRLSLAGELREAWWALAAARLADALARQRLRSVGELEGTVQRRYRQGEVARVDANLATTERLAAEAEALDAEQALRQAEQAYRLLTGGEAPASQACEPAQAAPDAAAHPQLQALRSALAAARSRLGLQEASARDAPELALRWTRQRSDASLPYDQALGVKLTIPLSSAARGRQAGAAARAELAQAEAELAQAELRVQQGLLRAHGEVDASQRQLALADQRLALATDSLQLAQRAFDLGESDLSALLRVRAVAHDAQSWLTRQQTAGCLSRSRLLQAQGVLP